METKIADMKLINRKKSHKQSNKISYVMSVKSRIQEKTFETKCRT